MSVIQLIKIHRSAAEEFTMEERNTDITKLKDKDVQTALVNRILLTVVIVLTAVLLAGMLISSHGTYI